MILKHSKLSRRLDFDISDSVEGEIGIRSKIERTSDSKKGVKKNRFNDTKVEEECECGMAKKGIKKMKEIDCSFLVFT
jgi:hypothetical protein